VRKVLACGAACALLAWLATTGACTTNALVGQGGACFQSIDCQLGLVCKNLNDAGGVCTNDLTGVVSVPEAGAADAAQPDVVTDAPADQTVTDTGTQDTGTQDTGTQDTGTQDTGAGDSATD
jgi:hypothetical protein